MIGGPRPLPWVAALRPAVHGAVQAAPGARVLDFSANGNVLGPSPAVAEALAGVDLSCYPDPGASRLRAALAERHGVETDSVMVGNGSSDLIWALARAYLTIGMRTLVVGPTYGEYGVACAATGAEVIEARCLLPGQEPDLGGLRAICRDTGPTMVWVCNPNNPSGAALTDELLCMLLDLAPGALIVVDEAYLPLTKEVRSALPLVASAPLVVLRSMTKDAALAGLRIGYAVAAAEIADAVTRVLPPWSVSSIAQAAALATLGDWRHAEQVREAVCASRIHLERGLRRLGLDPYPSVCNFLLVSVGDGRAVAERLLAQGLAVRDCASFGLPECIRIGVRPIAEQDELLAALGAVLCEAALG